ncbi:MAG: hypothetical protein EB069_02120 [Actinobacteria bacterium]|nr:hypothetical protein [Actinomycetota bacterium]
MSKFLNPSLVLESFERLASKSEGGKAHLERTSAILYFLAFDAACHSMQKNELDLEPDKFEGKNNRKQLELEFTKIVLLDSEHGQPIQFLEFGKIDTGNITPEKRISANFLTVPLKKATTASQPFHYPNRPRAPLLKLGTVATKKKWGMARHEDYEKNLFVILSTARSSMPAFDLAVLIFRDSTFSNTHQDIYSGLYEQLEKKFTPGVAALFTKRIDREKILIRSKNLSFVDHYSNFIKAEKKKATTDDRFLNVTRDDLIVKIHELEATINRLNNKA